MYIASATGDSGLVMLLFYNLKPKRRCLAQYCLPMKKEQWSLQLALRTSHDEVIQKWGAEWKLDDPRGHKKREGPDR